MRLLIINGPNLNLLGRREPQFYGSRDFHDYLSALETKYRKVHFEYFQSNREGEIIDKLQEAEDQFDGIILNAGAYSHTSIAIAEALRSMTTDVIEVHISNIYTRESFRHTSYLAPYCKGVIIGFGLDSYRLAVESFLLKPI